MLHPTPGVTLAPPGALTRSARSARVGTDALLTINAAGSIWRRPPRFPVRSRPLVTGN
jgi:hypothetical protein